jgi:type VI secretion system protein ImpK
VQPAEPISAASLDTVGFGLGPLAQAATPLLLLAGQLRGSLTGPEVSSLRRHAMEEIRRFEDRARSAGIQNETILTARYAICAALDEAVLSTPWGAQSEWTQQSLLVALHRETWGGEKFFDVLDRVSSDAKHHVDLMEVQYLCLALGFAGKYQLADRGHSRLADIQHDLYRKIRDYRGAAPEELSPRWKGIEDRRNPLIRYVPWWVVGAAVLACVMIVFATYSSWLRSDARGLQAEIAKIGSTMALADLADNGLEPYLTQQKAEKLLKIEDKGARVVLADFFKSNSDQWTGDAATRVLTAVCRALDHFPTNPVLVVGHTDDAAPRGGRFMNNMDLSEKRAQNVTNFLKKCVGSNSDRVTPKGRGDLDNFGPDRRPESRRVEIILGRS